MAGQRIGKEKEENFPLGMRLRPPGEHKGAGKSLRRARGVPAEVEESPQESLEPEGGRKLPSFEEEG